MACEYHILIYDPKSISVYCRLISKRCEYDPFKCRIAEGLQEICGAMEETMPESVAKVARFKESYKTALKALIEMKPR